MALSDLMNRQHPANPKSHDLGAVITSYKAYGYVAPGVIDELSGLFLCGHGRTQALNMMKRQKMEAPGRIDVRDDDWYVPTNRGVRFENEAQVKGYLIADNRLTILGGWDEHALVDMLQELATIDEEMVISSGYDLDDLDALLFGLSFELIGDSDNVDGKNQRDIMDKIHGTGARLIRFEFGDIGVMVDSVIYQNTLKILGGVDNKATMIEQIIKAGIDVISSHS